jgi:hypothetical protein
MSAFFLFIGATAATILAERADVSTPVLIVIVVVSYGTAVLFAWRPRWVAAWDAFWAPIDSKPSVHGQIAPSSTMSITGLSSRIRGSSLREFQGQYDVAFMIGVNDSSINKFEETRIAISPPFKIVKSDFDVTVPYSASMMEPLEKQNAAVRESLKKAGVPTGTPFLVHHEISVWQEVLLLPKGLSVAELRKLSDVERHGGKIVSQEISEGRFAVKP